MKTDTKEWKRIADNWERIVTSFDANVRSNNGATPDDFAKSIIADFGMNTVKETLAVVCEAKRHDGRIYDENRKYLKPFLPESVVEDLAEDEMAIVKARIGHLDDIHSTHINQTISALSKIERLHNALFEEKEADDDVEL